ncbi:MAG: rhodanese-like domain-containing protein [Gallionella sp.]
MDVREPGVYADARAPDATLIPLGESGARLGEITAYKHKPIAVMCHSGNRSAKAVRLLEKPATARSAM